MTAAYYSTKTKEELRDEKMKLENKITELRDVVDKASKSLEAYKEIARTEGRLYGSTADAMSFINGLYFAKMGELQETRNKIETIDYFLLLLKK